MSKNETDSFKEKQDRLEPVSKTAHGCLVLVKFGHLERKSSKFVNANIKTKREVVGGFQLSM